ncbi:MAG: enoyl-CoA hydratase family protein [Myxococcota bacterium]
MNPMPEGLQFSEKDGIATITLARPESLNSLTFAIYARLRDLFAELETMSSVKVVVITGEGDKGFCSGGDVHDIIGKLLSYGAVDMTAFARMTGDVIRNMRRLRKPIIASINGTAAGAGAVIALAADLRIAAADAKIAFLFTKVGLTGADMGAAYLLPRVVGLSKATEMLMLGDSVKAEEAQRIGLFNEVVPRAELAARTQALATRLLEGPAFSLGMTKELLNNAMSIDLNTALDAEARAQTICMLAEDFKEFHASFVEKRKPKFKGR